jgi:hypothetical protein
MRQSLDKKANLAIGMAFALRPMLNDLQLTYTGNWQKLQLDRKFSPKKHPTKLF